MNRAKKPLAKTVEKKIKKEVHSAQKAYPVKKTKEYSDELTAKEMAKKFPKKPLKKLQAGIKKAEKTSIIKKSQTLPHKKTSKRTGPGEFSEPSTPAFVKQEGVFWNKALKKQTSTDRKIQVRKELKQVNKKTSRTKK